MSLGVYPNPVKQLLVLQSYGSLPIQLYDIRGVLKASWNTWEDKDVSSLLPGMYFVVQGNKRAKILRNKLKVKAGFNRPAFINYYLSR